MCFGAAACLMVKRTGFGMQKTRIQTIFLLFPNPVNLDGFFHFSEAHCPEWVSVYNCIYLVRLVHRFYFGKYI